MMDTVVSIHEIDSCLAKIVLNHTTMAYVHKVNGRWISEDGEITGSDLKEIRQNYQDRVLYNEYRGLPLTCGM